jgi:predicted AAA+ superfamily ATPase
MNNELQTLRERLLCVCVFRNLLAQPPVRALLAFLEQPESTERYGAFAAALEPYDYVLSDYVKTAVLTDENRYITALAHSKPLNEAVCANARAELELFGALTRLTPEALCAALPRRDGLPVFINVPTDVAALYAERCRNIKTAGYGVFSAAPMFRLREGAVIPVESADPILPEELTGYADERARVEENLLTLLRGGPAANMLLFGDAGTGKSSTVKALVNRYFGEGLRLIELKKSELPLLPEIMGRIERNPLRFVIFIDDLSFSKNDDSFSTLKSVLEGAAGARAENTVICATSNRRHIIKETISDREAGDDVHRGDTISELMSLTDRFGLTVYFGKPNKELYLTIVRALAARYGVPLSPELEAKAEAFALKKGGRSPRAARQFVLSEVPAKE